ncbi:Uncharacterized protein SCF082_LOCUS19908 [Durusdinium trenchii]|uniref:Ubiquitin-like domain-containing protein n=1 Tax=Durusdinium trenchii TaxID=1381693 RepID=A0ABP0KYU8_9DINO
MEKRKGYKTTPMLALSVVKANGDLVGTFHEPPDSLVLQLQQSIHARGGPAPPFQRLLCGPRELGATESLSSLREEDTTLQLLVVVPEGRPCDVRWLEVQHTDQLLEELQVEYVEEGRSKRLMPEQRVAVVGLEPDTGLLILVGTGFEENTPEGGKGFRKGRNHNREDCWAPEGYNFVESKMLVLPSTGGQAPFGVPLDKDHVLRSAVELQVVESARGYPMPSMGVAVAMVREDGYGPDCRMSLVVFEAVPQFLSETRYGLDSQAFCLDRPQLRALWAQPNRSGSLELLAAPLRSDGDRAAEVVALLPGSARVTSLAKTVENILITRAGFHSIEVYGLDGSWCFSIGDPRCRGCQDGARADVRFWFPVWTERLVCSAYGIVRKDSSPLIVGGAGRIFVYSGGVLMKLAEDLSVAEKVTSVREELWMIDGDEGTPQFPDVCAVVGIHDGYLYRILCRTDYREEVILRRLKCQDTLRQGRSAVRRRAPMIWPMLTQDKVLVAAHEVNVRPTYYNEESRDVWDGNNRWLRETWLWDADPRGRPPEAKELRMDSMGQLRLPRMNSGSLSPAWKDATPIFDD